MMQLPNELLCGRLPSHLQRSRSTGACWACLLTGQHCDSSFRVPAYSTANSGRRGTESGGGGGGNDGIDVAAAAAAAAEDDADVDDCNASGGGDVDKNGNAGNDKHGDDDDARTSTRRRGPSPAQPPVTARLPPAARQTALWPCWCATPPWAPPKAGGGSGLPQSAWATCGHKRACSCR